MGCNMAHIAIMMHDVLVVALSLLSYSLVKYVQQYGGGALYADAQLGDAPTCWPWPAQPSPLWVVLALVCVLLLPWLMVYLLHMRLV